MNNNFADKIINKIKERRLSMRPRWYFALQTLAVVLVSALAFGLGVWLLSWLYFILHANGVWFLPAFGGRGWLEFLRSFPWLPAGVGLALVMILAWLLEKFRFAYRQPIIFVSLGILLLVTGGGWLLARTPLHGAFYRRSFERGLPVVGPLYRGYGHPPRGAAYVGAVANVATSSFEITTTEGDKLFIVTDERTRWPFGFNLMPDDMVMVMGRRSENTLSAFGVREIKTEEGFYGHPRMMRRMLPPPRW